MKDDKQLEQKSLLVTGAPVEDVEVVTTIAIETRDKYSGYIWVKTCSGLNLLVHKERLFDLPGTPQKNPWRKFADNGDDPPEELAFGFSRFVTGKDIDGVKYPVIFDTQNAKWLTPRYPKVGAGEFWVKVWIVEWREL